MWLKNSSLVSECSEDMSCEKMGPICSYFSVDGVKQLVIISVHVHFSHKNEWTQDYLKSPKGAGQWRNPSDADTGNDCSLFLNCSCPGLPS